jgi:PTH2 family peptidyl-tRNA hydrolase
MKQVILVRMDLKMPAGKLAAMVAHASVEAALKSDYDILKVWKSLEMKKVVLKVKDKK